jgi:hypothetical protein
LQRHETEFTDAHEASAGVRAGSQFPAPNAPTPVAALAAAAASAATAVERIRMDASFRRNLDEVVQQQAFELSTSFRQYFLPLLRSKGNLPLDFELILPSWITYANGSFEACFSRFVLDWSLTNVTCVKERINLSKQSLGLHRIWCHQRTARMCVPRAFSRRLPDVFSQIVQWVQDALGSDPSTTTFFDMHRNDPTSTYLCGSSLTLADFVVYAQMFLPGALITLSAAVLFAH